jgi:hypothetical protein
MATATPGLTGSNGGHSQREKRPTGSAPGEADVGHCSYRDVWGLDRFDLRPCAMRRWPLFGSHRAIVSYRRRRSSWHRGIATQTQPRRRSKFADQNPGCSVEAFHVTMSQYHAIHLKGGASPSAAGVFDRPGANSVGCIGLLDDHHKQTSDGRAVSATSHDLAFGNE